MVGLCLGMTALAACGLWVVHEKGFPEREKFRQLAEVLENLNMPPQKNEAASRYLGEECASSSMYALYDDQQAPETVALVGDSHAWSAFHGVAELGREIGKNTLTLGWWVPGGHIWAPHLAGQHERVIRLLGERPEIKKVFLITRGLIYMTKTHNPGHRDKADVALAALIPPADFQAGLQDMVTRLRGMGKEVYVVAENPALNIDIRDVIRRGPTGVSIRETWLDTTRDDVLARQQPYLDLLAGIEGATIIDTLDAFCPESAGGVCRLFSDEGVPLYFDDDHLSWAGSLFQAKEILRPWLEE